MKNILISGGAGFIGSRLCIRLIEKGYVVTILDNLSKQIHGERESALFKSIKDKCTFIKGDVCCKKDWLRSIQGQDAVIHLAAETGTGQSMYELSRYNEVNVMGTANLLDVLANQEHRINKIIIASSRAIYGEGKYNCVNHGEQYPTERKEKDLNNGVFNPRCKFCNKELLLLATDEEARSHPLSIYGINKQQQEQMVMLMGTALGIPAVAFRYQNVYGPGQSLSNPYTGILSVFATRILNGNNIDIYEDGQESRDFVYIDDVVDATILGLEKNSANGEVFNVGSGEPTTVLSVAETLKRMFNVAIKIHISGNYRLGDIRHNYADLTKIKKLLGFTPRFNFQQGIALFVDWVKTQDLEEDKYEYSRKELQRKGLIR